MKSAWTWKALGEVCDTGAGGTPLSSRKEYYEGGKIPWLVSGEVAQGNVREAKHFITKAGLENSSAKLFPTDTVLVAMYGATAGQVGILRFRASTNQAVCGILPGDQFIPEFLFYFLLAKRDDLVAQATGNAQPNISQIKIRNTKVPILPRDEQRRIVEVLDEAFEGLATAKANAEKNLQNARALFESHLQSVFTQRGTSWAKTTLEKATAGIFTGPFGSLLHKHDYVENGIPLVNPAHITEMGIEPDMRKTVSDATAKRLANYIMHKGDVVIGRRGDMGRCALVTEVEDGWLCGTGSFYIKPSDRCDMGYLVRYLRSKGCRKQLEDLAGGAVMPNLSNAALGGLLIFLPALRDQKRIVDEIDDLAAETQRLARIYEQKLAALDALKKSLLHQAFSGNL